MTPWIQVYSNLIRHPKVTNLADKLGVSSKDCSPNAVAAGMLVSLWLWAAQNATDGDLSQCSDRAIAEAAEFRRKPASFVAALIECKLLDADRRLHDWDEYATLLMDWEDRQRKKTRDRVARHRAKKKSVTNGECNVTVTPCNAPTLPNLTLPDLTIHPSYSFHTEGSKSLSEAFARFWESYPAKTEFCEKDAWAVWLDLFSRPAVPNVEDIMAGLETWKHSGRWEPEFPRYVPNPARFLAEERWRNPPAAPAQCSLGAAEKEVIQKMLEAE